jgi:hypothetical protein
MVMNGETQIAYFNSHAPRCIAEFKTIATDRPPASFDGHGEPLNSFFRLTCAKCGGAEFVPRGCHCVIDIRGEKHDYFADPITLVCAGCECANLLFDPKTDGYDAEACDFGGSPSEGNLGEFKCSCGSASGMSQVVTRFEYPSDLFEMDIVINGSRRAENLFSWFSLVGICKKCNDWVEIFEYECA